MGKNIYVKMKKISSFLFKMPYLIFTICTDYHNGCHSVNVMTTDKSSDLLDHFNEFTQINQLKNNTVENDDIKIVITGKNKDEFIEEMLEMFDNCCKTEEEYVKFSSYSYDDMIIEYNKILFNEKYSSDVIDDLKCGIKKYDDDDDIISRIKFLNNILSDNLPKIFTDNKTILSDGFDIFIEDNYDFIKVYNLIEHKIKKYKESRKSDIYTELEYEEATEKYEVIRCEKNKKNVYVTNDDILNNFKDIFDENVIEIYNKINKQIISINNEHFDHLLKVVSGEISIGIPGMPQPPSMGIPGMPQPPSMGMSVMSSIGMWQHPSVSHIGDIKLYSNIIGLANEYGITKKGDILKLNKEIGLIDKLMNLQMVKLIHYTTKIDKPNFYSVLKDDDGDSYQFNVKYVYSCNSIDEIIKV